MKVTTIQFSPTFRNKQENLRRLSVLISADVVCLSANWGDGGFPAVSWMDFVEENSTCLIVSNRYGQEGPR
jgi:hypothetical protein